MAEANRLAPTKYVLVNNAVNILEVGNFILDPPSCQLRFILAGVIKLTFADPILASFGGHQRALIMSLGLFARH
jgi:hypothetical protein